MSRKESAFKSLKLARKLIAVFIAASMLLSATCTPAFAKTNEPILKFLRKSSASQQKQISDGQSIVNKIEGAMHEGNDKPKRRLDALKRWLGFKEIDIEKWAKEQKEKIGPSEEKLLSEALDRIDIHKEWTESVAGDIIVCDNIPKGIRLHRKDPASARIGGLIIRTEEGLKVLFPAESLKDLNNKQNLADLRHEVVELFLRKRGKEEEEAHKIASDMSAYFLQTRVGEEAFKDQTIDLLRKLIVKLCIGNTYEKRDATYLLEEIITSKEYLPKDDISKLLDIVVKLLESQSNDDKKFAAYLFGKLLASKRQLLQGLVDGGVWGVLHLLDKSAAVDFKNAILEASWRIFETQGKPEDSLLEGTLLESTAARLMELLGDQNEEIIIRAIYAFKLIFANKNLKLSQKMVEEAAKKMISLLKHDDVGVQGYAAESIYFLLEADYELPKALLEEAEQELAKLFNSNHPRLAFDSAKTLGVLFNKRTSYFQPHASQCFINVFKNLRELSSRKGVPKSENFDKAFDVLSMELCEPERIAVFKVYGEKIAAFLTILKEIMIMIDDRQEVTIIDINRISEDTLNKLKEAEKVSENLPLIRKSSIYLDIDPDSQLGDWIINFIHLIRGVARDDAVYVREHGKKGLEILLPPSSSASAQKEIIDFLIFMQVIPEETVIRHHLAFDGRFQDEAKFIELANIVIGPAIDWDRQNHKTTIGEVGPVNDYIDKITGALMVEFTGGFVCNQYPDFHVTRIEHFHKNRPENIQYLIKALQSSLKVQEDKTLLDKKLSGIWANYVSDLKRIFYEYGMDDALGVKWMSDQADANGRFENKWENIKPSLIKLEQKRADNPGIIKEVQDLLKQTTKRIQAEISNYEDYSTEPLYFPEDLLLSTDPGAKRKKVVDSLTTWTSSSQPAPNDLVWGKTVAIEDFDALCKEIQEGFKNLKGFQGEEKMAITKLLLNIILSTFGISDKVAQKCLSDLLILDAKTESMRSHAASFRQLQDESGKISWDILNLLEEIEKSAQDPKVKEIVNDAGKRSNILLTYKESKADLPYPPEDLGRSPDMAGENNNTQEKNVIIPEEGVIFAKETDRRGSALYRNMGRISRIVILPEQGKAEVSYSYGDEDFPMEGKKTAALDSENYLIKTKGRQRITLREYFEGLGIILPSMVSVGKKRVHEDVRNIIRDVILKSKAIEIDAEKKEVFRIKIDGKKMIDKDLAELFDKAGVFRKINEAKDGELLKSIIDKKDNFAGYSEEEKSALIDIARKTPLSMVHGEFAIDGANLLCHARRGKGELAPTIWIGHGLFSQLNKEELAEFLLEESQHILRKDALCFFDNEKIPRGNKKEFFLHSSKFYNLLNSKIPLAKRMETAKEKAMPDIQQAPTLKEGAILPPKDRSKSPDMAWQGKPDYRLSLVPSLSEKAKAVRHFAGIDLIDKLAVMLNQRTTIICAGEPDMISDEDIISSKTMLNGRAEDYTDIAGAVVSTNKICRIAKEYLDEFASGEDKKKLSSEDRKRLIDTLFQERFNSILNVILSDFDSLPEITEMCRTLAYVTTGDHWIKFSDDLQRVYNCFSNEILAEELTAEYNLWEENSILLKKALKSNEILLAAKKAREKISEAEIRISLADKPKVYIVFSNEAVRQGCGILLPYIANKVNEGKIAVIAEDKVVERIIKEFNMSLGAEEGILIYEDIESAAIGLKIIGAEFIKYVAAKDEAKKRYSYIDEVVLISDVLAEVGKAAGVNELIEEFKFLLNVRDEA